MNTLDAPDVAFYAGDALNASAVALALAPLVAQAPALAASGFTGLVLEVTGVEDFISYDYLGNGSEVYAAGDAHRARADAWAAALAPALAACASAGLAPHLMFFELMFPPALARRYNLTLRAPGALRAVLEAKFRELFARLPALAGALVYVADAWSPRAGYAFAQLWSSVAELAQTATIFYEAFTAAAPPHARLIFSLWTPPGAGDVPADEWWAVVSLGLPVVLRPSGSPPSRSSTQPP
jgi:hypothetical protein